MEENYLVEKWLNDELTPSEMKEFENMENASTYKEIVQEAQRFGASDQLTPLSYDAIESKIAAKALPERLSFKRYFKGIAAAAIFALGLLWMWTSNTVERYSSDIGEQIVIELPDASKVILNAKSQLSYDKNTWKDARTLELQGEAFFDVAKGATFEVHTAQGVVTVLGTEFSIKERSGWFEVICYEGEVQVQTAKSTQKLLAGDEFRWIDNQTYLERSVQKTPTWTHQISSFERVPIAEVFEELERQFEVRIHIKIRDPKTLFTGAFEHDNLENALMEITTPLNLTYRFISKDSVNIHDKTE